MWSPCTRYDVVREPGWEVSASEAWPRAVYAVTVSSDPARSSKSSGSETIWAPTGTVVASRPAKVTRRRLPGSTALTPALPSRGRATVTAVSGSGVSPYALEKRSRMRGPPAVTRTVCRRVVSTSTDDAPVYGAGGRLAGSVSWGMPVQVCTQCRPGSAAAVTGAVLLTSAVSAEAVTARARTRTQVLSRVANGVLRGGFTETFPGDGTRRARGRVRGRYGRVRGPVPAGVRGRYGRVRGPGPAGARGRYRVRPGARPGRVRAGTGVPAGPGRRERGAGTGAPGGPARPGAGRYRCARGPGPAGCAPDRSDAARRAPPGRQPTAQAVPLRLYAAGAALFPVCVAW